MEELSCLTQKFSFFVGPMSQSAIILRTDDDAEWWKSSKSDANFVQWDPGDSIETFYDRQATVGSLPLSGRGVLECRGFDKLRDRKLSVRV